MTGRQVPAPKFHPLMWKRVQEGRKVATTRRERIGEPGDWWEWGENRPCRDRFRIVDVMEAPFGTITSEFYRVEGFETPEAFEIFWIRIHRGNLPEPEEMRHIHFFARIADGVEP